MKGFWSWQPPENSAFLECCRDSFAHGLKYVGEEGATLLQRIIWTLIILASMGYLFHLIDEGVIQALSSTVLISMQTEDVTIKQIPFPAVTICNGNKIQLSKFKELEKYESLQAFENDSAPTAVWMALLYVTNYCTTSASFKDMFENRSITLGEEDRIDNAEIFKIIRTTLSSCEEMLLRCMWNHEIFPCDKLFVPILTELGICCVFNMMPTEFLVRPRPDTENILQLDEKLAWLTWDIDCDLVQQKEPNGICRERKNAKAQLNISDHFPRRQSDAGMPTGLSVILNPQLDEIFPSCKNIDSEGFRIQVHSPLNIPSVRDFGKTINPNSEVFVAAKATLTTVEDDYVREIPLEKRKCYFLFEFYLETFSIYTQQNCVDECITNLTKHFCSCYLYYMPTRPNDTTPMCLTKAEFICWDDLKRNISRTTLCQQCLPSCTQIEYFADTTKLPLRDDVELWSDIAMNGANWTRDDVSIVHVFFGKDNVDARVRKNLYDISQIIANAGGLAGVQMGFSMICLADPIYFFLLTLRRMIKSKISLRNKKIKSKSSNNVPEEGKTGIIESIYSSSEISYKGSLAVRRNKRFNI